VKKTGLTRPVPPRSGLVQLLSELPQAPTIAGRLSPGDGFNNKIQIGCNIRQLPQFVNVSFPDKSRHGGGLSP